jgi:hypothetical protein
MKGLDKAAQQQQKDKPSGIGGTGDGKTDLDQKALDKLAKDKQQLAVQTAEVQRTLDNKIFQNQIELDRKRYELQQQLIDLQAQNEIDSLTGVAKEYAGRADQFRKQLRDMYRQGAEASLQASIARQQMQSAQSVQSVTGGGISTTGMIARTAPSTETTSTLTVASANRTIQATGDITIPNAVFSAGDIILIYAGASARTLTQGASVTMRLGGTATTGSRTLAARGVAVLFFVSSSEVVVSGGAVT